jgi:signal transduction histidine kinase/ligand-binding sensor domain-containing protein
MAIPRIKCFLFIFVSLFCLPVFGQKPFINFDRIDNAKGLPSNTINDILKDQRGFVWIATNDGLCRYDAPGKFKIYTANDSKQEDGLQSNSIKCLFQDSKHNLWVGTRQGGLSRLNIETNEWKTYMHDSKNPESLCNNEVLTIIEGKDQNLWIGTESGLCVFNPETEKFFTFKKKLGSNNHLNADAILSLHKDERGYVLVGTWNKGLYLYDEYKYKELNSEGFVHTLPNPDTLSFANNVWKIFQDKQKRYWLGTIGGGLIQMEVIKTDQDWQFRYRSFLHNNNNKFSICNNYIQDIYQDNEERLWIGTTHGLSRVVSTETLDSKDDNPLKFYNYFYDPYSPISLSSNLINCLFQDEQGILWVGTSVGISVYNWYNNQIGINYLNINNTLTYNVHGLANLDDRFIYLATQEGLLKYNLKTNSTVIVDHFNEQILSKYLNSMLSTEDGILYTSNTYEIIKYDAKSKEIVKYNLKELVNIDLETLLITQIYKDSRDILWVATEIGLLELHEKTKYVKLHQVRPEKENSISDNSITSIEEDRKGNIWIGSYNGLNKIEYNEDGNHRFKIYKYNEDKGLEYTMVSNRITCLKIIKDILYIGTTDGISKLDINTSDFLNTDAFKKKYFVQSFVKSNKDELWAGTSEGLLSYDPVKEALRNFEKQGGIGDIRYTFGSSYIDHAGIIYFGFKNGFIKIDPSKIIFNEIPPKVYLTEAKLIDGEKTAIKSLTNSKELTLEHDNYYLSISYACLNYNQPEKNSYAYKLEGFEEDWNYSSENITPVYTNLDKGKYTFLVKAANNDGVWSEEPTKLEIEVMPAFWETWWFLISSILLFILALVFGIRKYNTNLYNRNLALSKLNNDLNSEISERKRIQEILTEKEQHMEHLVNVRTSELKSKNQEVELLAAKLKNRNVELEELVLNRTKKLSQSNDELKRSNRDLEQFAYVASHDLKEPLRSVRGFIDLLDIRYKSKLDEKGNNYINFIKEGVVRMSSLIQSLLSYSKVGQVEIEFSEIDLNHIIDDKLEDLSQLIYERKAVIEKEKFPQIVAEENQLGMVFYNLITNAIKFNKGEKPLVKISLENRSSNDVWQFAIEDNGIGIDKVYQDQIFELFTRLHSKDEFDGTGIGLSLCKKIIERHGGKIWLDSELGKGAIFRFTISKHLKN